MPVRVERLLCVLDPSLIAEAVSVTSPLPREAQTWGYPADSSVGRCLAQQSMKKVLFPDEALALAALHTDLAEAQAICAVYRNPKPLWCNYLYYWKWGCKDISQYPQGCKHTYCGGCPSVTDCGYTCKNCRGRGAIENGDYISRDYWCYVCSPADPPPSQVMDPPITTEMTDRNGGGECEGACNTTINDSSGDR